MKPYRFADWREAHEGQRLFSLRPVYAEVYGRWSPRAWKWEGWLADLAYYLRCRVWTRYNRFDVRTLPPTWQDADEKLLHVCFHVLGEVIEKERIFEENAPEGDPLDGESWAWALAEMRALWTWWTVERQQALQAQAAALSEWHDAFERAGGLTSEPTESPRLRRLVFGDSDEENALHDQHRAIEEANEAKDEEMLIRLMKVRRYLWT